MFLNLSRVIVHAGRSLNLSGVFELGVRRVVYLHAARLNLSRFFRLRGLRRGWENSYLGGSCGDRSGQIIRIILISERQIDHHKIRPVEG